MKVYCRDCVFFDRNPNKLSLSCCLAYKEDFGKWYDGRGEGDGVKFRFCNINNRKNRCGAYLPSEEAMLWMTSYGNWKKLMDLIDDEKKGVMNEK